MKLSRLRKADLAFASMVLAMTMSGACLFDPQPEPPAEDEASADGSGGASGDGGGGWLGGPFRDPTADTDFGNGTSGGMGGAAEDGGGGNGGGSTTADGGGGAGGGELGGGDPGRDSGACATVLDCLDDLIPIE